MFMDNCYECNALCTYKTRGKHLFDNNNNASFRIIYSCFSFCTKIKKNKHIFKIRFNLAVFQRQNNHNKSMFSPTLMTAHHQHSHCSLSYKMHNTNAPNSTNACVLLLRLYVHCFSFISVRLCCFFFFLVFVPSSFLLPLHWQRYEATQVDRGALLSWLV